MDSPEAAPGVKGDSYSNCPLSRSVTFRGRGEMGDDVYDLAFANGGVRMSAALDSDGRMVGGILEPAGTPGR